MFVHNGKGQSEVRILHDDHRLIRHHGMPLIWIGYRVVARLVMISMCEQLS